MRLFYISSGCGFEFQNHLSDEDQNIIHAFRQLEKIRPNFKLETFLLRRDGASELEARITLFRPDFILVFRGACLPSSVVYKLRSFKVPIGVWVVDDPYRLRTHEKLVQPYDLVITQDSSSMLFYKKRKKVCLHVPLAVNSDKYKPLVVADKYKSDICFVGSAFPIRVNFFDTLTPLLLKKKTLIIGQWWERLKNYSKLKHCIHNDPIPPSEVVKYYNGAKVVLNIHRTQNDRNDNPFNYPANTPNNRTFEIASCRAFQLVTWRKDLHKFYELDKEMITFRNLKDLKEKVLYYLKNDDERSCIANEAYQKTLSHHTYFVRLRYLLHLLEKTPLLSRKNKLSPVD